MAIFCIHVSFRFFTEFLLGGNDPILVFFIHELDLDSPISSIHLIFLRLCLWSRKPVYSQAGNRERLGWFLKGRVANDFVCFTSEDGSHMIFFKDAKMEMHEWNSWGNICKRDGCSEFDDMQHASITLRKSQNTQV